MIGTLTKQKLFILKEPERDEITFVIKKPFVSSGGSSVQTEHASKQRNANRRWQ